MIEFKTKYFARGITSGWSKIDITNIPTCTMNTLKDVSVPKARMTAGCGICPSNGQRWTTMHCNNPFHSRCKAKLLTPIVERRNHRARLGNWVSSGSLWNPDVKRKASIRGEPPKRPKVLDTGDFETCFGYLNFPYHIVLVRYREIRGRY